MKQPESAYAAVIIDGLCPKLMLQHRRSPVYGVSVWELPGGACEASDPDIAATAFRELGEEWGPASAAVDPAGLASQWAVTNSAQPHINVKSRCVGIAVYTVSKVEAKAAVTSFMPNEEATELKIFSFRHLPDLAPHFRHVIIPSVVEYLRKQGLQIEFPATMHRIRAYAAARTEGFEEAYPFVERVKSEAPSGCILAVPSNTESRDYAFRIETEVKTKRIRHNVAALVDWIARHSAVIGRCEALEIDGCGMFLGTQLEHIELMHPWLKGKVTVLRPYDPPR